MLRREERNILEAASNGAATSVALVANIAANLIAFLAVLEFINAALSWFGGMVDIEGLSFQVSPCSRLPNPASPTYPHLCPLLRPLLGVWPALAEDVQAGDGQP